jgi:hypothetical protein
MVVDMKTSPADTEGVYVDGQQTFVRDATAGAVQGSSGQAQPLIRAKRTETLHTAR